MFSQPLRIRSPPNRSSDRKQSSWLSSRFTGTAGAAGRPAAEGGVPSESFTAGNPKSPLSRGGRSPAGSKLPRSKASLSDDDDPSFESPSARSPSSPTPRSPSLGNPCTSASGAAKLLPHIPPPSHGWTNHRGGFSVIGNTGGFATTTSSSTSKGVSARSRKGGGYGGDSASGGMSPGPSSPWRRAGASGGASGSSVGSRLQNILLVIILFLCSNFAGHYYPFLWSSAARASAVQSLLATRQHLPDIRTGRGEQGGVGDERNSDGSIILSEEGRRSIMALAAADGLREGEIGAQQLGGGLGGGLGGTNGAGGGVSRRPWQSRFVQDVRIDVGREAMCADIVPDEFRESTARM
ncbi:unnamed protein product [Closterium sp. NIES-54]